MQTTSRISAAKGSTARLALTIEVCHQRTLLGTPDGSRRVDRLNRRGHPCRGIRDTFFETCHSQPHPGQRDPLQVGGMASRPTKRTARLGAGEVDDDDEKRLAEQAGLIRESDKKVDPKMDDERRIYYRIHIEATPGEVIDYDRIRRRVNELGERYAIREIAIDRWNATQLA